MNYTKEAGRSLRFEVRGLLRLRQAYGNRRKFVITAIIFLIFGLSANAQMAGKSIPEIRQEMNADVLTFQHSTIPTFQYSLSKYKNFHSQPTVPIIYSYHNLALFCKIEVKLEKAVKLPIKFRLGEVEYVDRLEGKY